MLTEFQAGSDIRGYRINLEWIWVTDADTRPAFRLMRRTRAYPSGPDEGFCVLDTTELFSQPGLASARIERRLFLGHNMIVESDLGLVEVVYFFNAMDAEKDRPFQVAVSYNAPDPDNPASTIWRTMRLEGVTHIELAERSEPPWDKVEVCDIYTATEDGDQKLVGTLVISSGHQDGTTPYRVEWRAAGAPTVSLPFEQQVSQATTVILADIFDQDRGERTYRVSVADLGLEPEVFYYYALFVKPDQAAGAFQSERTWRAVAMATGHYGLDERLYQLLPALHKQYDEPMPDQLGAGQLRRFLQISGAALDQIRSQAESLRGRHDLLEVHADRLPALAHWIGWQLDRTLDTLSQRNQIRFAPDIYRGVGTIPNIKALVNMITGWDCRVKEFAHNVFRSNAPETVHLWELWESRFDGKVLSKSDPLTEHLPDPDIFEGRPVAVIDGSGRLWLFWHTSRAGRWQIWGRIHAGHAWSASLVLTPEPGAHQEPAAIADGAAVRLFWASNTTGNWEITSRSCMLRPDGQVDLGALEQVVSHPAEDRHPAVVRDGQGRIWLFWQSSRRGPTDIWAQVYDGERWGAPARITTARFCHEMPAALRIVRDGTEQTWLFYVASNHGGDRRSLVWQVFDGTRWAEPETISTESQQVESPAPVFWNGQVWLFWQAGGEEHPGIWVQTHTSAGWSDSFAIIDHFMGDKEPAVVVDPNAGLRVFWRSRRRGLRHQSRTLDLQDAEMMADLRTYGDTTHYSFETGTANDDWYAQGTVGLYIVPDTEDSALFEYNQALIKSALQPFLPAQVRLVFIQYRRP